MYHVWWKFSLTKLSLRQNTCISATLIFHSHFSILCHTSEYDVWMFHSDPVEDNVQLPPDQALARAVRQQEYRCQNRQRRRWSGLQQELCPPETRAWLAKSLEGEEAVCSPLVRLVGAWWFLFQPEMRWIIYLFQDVQQKVRPYLLGIDMSHFKYDDFIRVLGIVKRSVVYVCKLLAVCTVCYGWKNMDPVVLPWQLLLPQAGTRGHSAVSVVVNSYREQLVLSWQLR